MPIDEKRELQTPRSSSQPGFWFAARHADPAGLGENATTSTEAEQIFATLETLLQKAGLEFRDIVRTRLFYSERSDYAAMNAVRDPFFRSRFSNDEFPTSSGPVTGGRGGVRPNLEIEIVACPGKAAVNAPDVIQEWSGVRPAFKHANMAGGVLFASGQSPFTVDGEIGSQDPVGQTNIVLASLSKVLAAAGRGDRDILSITAYVSPEGEAAKSAMLAAIDAFVAASKTEAPPIVTVIEVPALFKPGMSIAMELCARNSEAQTATARGANGAQAARHECLLIAKSEALGTGNAADSFGLAISDLRTVLKGVGVAFGDIGLLTLWFSPACNRSELEILARKTFGSDVALTIVPKADAGPALIVEALGSVRTS